MKTKTTIAILDDHFLIGEAIKSILEDNSNYQVTKIYINYKELLQDLENGIIKLDILFLDINLNDDLNGIDICKIINNKYPEIKINIITSHNQKSLIIEILQNKISGFMIKNISTIDLIKGLDKIVAGELYIHNDIYKLLQSNKSKSKHNEKPILTKREKEVLVEIFYGSTTQQIAKKLFISKYTVETHRANIHSKTGTNNLAGLIKYTLDNDLIL
jgi:DNA-binding NarL/FixJ family response regulator